MDMREMLEKWLLGQGGLLKVRALLAIGVTGVTMYMFMQEIPVSDAQLVLNTGIDGYYFATRAKEPAP